MDPLNKVKIRYKFRSEYKGGVSGNKKDNFGPESRGGTHNKKSITRFAKKAQSVAKKTKASGTAHKSKVVSKAKKVA